MARSPSHPPPTSTGILDYTISDGTGGTDTAAVAITVLPVADAPVAVADTASTYQDIPLVLHHADLVTPNDTDADGDPLVISAVSNPVNGTVALNPDGSITFTPTANFHGAASFDYTISDGTGGTATATVAITVKPVANMGDWLDHLRHLTAAPEEDSDGDSVSNAIEYVIGGNPANAPTPPGCQPRKWHPSRTMGLPPNIFVSPTAAPMWLIRIPLR